MKRQGNAIREYRQPSLGLMPWAFLAPMLVLLGVMTVVPAVWVAVNAFRSETLLNNGGTFVGFANFVSFFTNPDQVMALVRTVVFAFGVVVVELIIGMLLALPLAKSSRNNNAATAILLLPFAVTPVVSALIFRELLNPNYGWVNWALDKLGLPSTIDWLGSSGTAWLSLVALDVWQWTPFVALILIAGLQSLPKEPEEAASIDGAGYWQVFRYVTLPQLLPFIAIAVVLRLIQAFKTFDSFKVMTNGGPGTSTEITNLEIYRIALQSFRIGAASAIALVFLMLLLLVIPALLRAIGRDRDSREAM